MGGDSFLRVYVKQCYKPHLPICINWRKIKKFLELEELHAYERVRRRDSSCLEILALEGKCVKAVGFNPRGAWPLHAKPTTIKEALKRWEDKHGMDPAEATEVNLYFQWPPIEKMDNSLAVLVKCEKLSLSTNMIEKISGINSLKNLKILAIGRNYIKSFSGLEGLGDTLEELWISYNLIDKFKGINFLKKLKVLYMSNNFIREWAEFVKLAELPLLEDLLLVGNPLNENLEEAQWRAEAIKRLPNLKKLDGEPVIREEAPEPKQAPVPAE